MGNYLLHSECTDPHMNLALEEALAEHMRPGDAALYLWQNKNTVVIGRNQNAWRECRCQLLQSEGGTLARRSTGGGAVYHDLGNLNFTFAACPERYNLEKQLQIILDALNGMGIAARFSGRNDILAEDGRKFSGNAFRHTKNWCIHHGTLLVKANLEKLNRYLNPHAEKLQAKGVTSVRARVCNLQEFAHHITIEGLKTALANSFQAMYGPATLLHAENLNFAEKHAQYSAWEWNYGHTPAFDVQLQHRFDWGIVELLLQLNKGLVTKAHVYSDAMDADLPALVETLLTGRKYGPELAEALQDYPDIAQWLREELPI